MTPPIACIEICDRLKWHYAHRTPLPEADDNMDDLVAAGVVAPRTLSLNQLQRLIRAVIGEFVEGT